jgi:hypothetical protein
VNDARRVEVARKVASNPLRRVFFAEEPEAQGVKRLRSLQPDVAVEAVKIKNVETRNPVGVEGHRRTGELHRITSAYSAVHDRLRSHLSQPITREATLDMALSVPSLASAAIAK